MNSVFSEVPAFKESRLASLFSDFARLKELNPEGFEANLQAWKNLLLQCLQRHTFQSSLSLPLASLVATLSSPVYGEPKALGLVLDSLVRSQTLIPWSIYKDYPVGPRRSYTELLSPSRVLSRSYASFKLSHYSPNVAMALVGSDHLLHWPSLVSTAQRVCRLLEEKVAGEATYSARLMDSEMFSSAVKSIDSNLSDVDVEAVRTYLTRDTGALAWRKSPQHPDKIYIKVGAAPASLSAEDTDVVDVKAQIKVVERQVESLEHVLDCELPERISKLLGTKNAENRLRYVLVKKARVSRDLNSAVAVLDKLTSILDKINSAQSNVAIYESLQSAKSILSLFNKQVALEDIDEVTEEIDAQIALTDEISQAVLLPSDYDEESIDKEMERLEMEHAASPKDTGEERASVALDVEHKSDKSETKHYSKSSESVHGMPALKKSQNLGNKNNSLTQRNVDSMESGPVDYNAHELAKLLPTESNDTEQLVAKLESVSLDSAGNSSKDKKSLQRQEKELAPA